MTWHPPAEKLRRYLAGSVTETVAWSVEAHLTECERCRRLLAGVSAADDSGRQRLDDGWATLAAALPPQGGAPAGTRWREARMLLAGERVPTVLGYGLAITYPDQFVAADHFTVEGLALAELARQGCLDEVAATIAGMTNGDVLRDPAATTALLIELIAPQEIPIVPYPRR